MRENIAIDDKLQGETRRYSHDWAPYLAVGDSLDGEPIAPTMVYGSVDVSAVAKTGTVETFTLSAGERGATALLLGVHTAQGDLLQQVVTLRIL